MEGGDVRGVGVGGDGGGEGGAEAGGVKPGGAVKLWLECLLAGCASPLSGAWKDRYFHRRLAL